MFLGAAAVTCAQGRDEKGRDEVLGCCSISQSLGPSQAGSAPEDSQAMRESSGVSPVPSGISTASQGQSLAFPKQQNTPFGWSRIFLLFLPPQRFFFHEGLMIPTLGAVSSHPLSVFLAAPFCPQTSPECCLTGARDDQGRRSTRLELIQGVL